jgi:hypothetical protein
MRAWWGQILCLAGMAVLLCAGSPAHAQQASVPTHSQGGAPVGQPDQLSLAGAWAGRYFYPDGKKSVEFSFVFDADACRGRSEEPNTFGDKSASKLFGNLACDTLSVRPGERIAISKTYDGTGGVSHTVTYNGIISADLSEIAGEWSIGKTRGAFNLRRK